jgi:glucokinase
MAPDPTARLALAVDIGGTKLAVGLVDDTGDLLHEAQVPTPAHGDGDAMFRALDELIGTVRGVGRDRGWAEPVVCGVGTGGPMTLHGVTVSPVNIPAWRAFPLRARLLEATGLPVHIDNDAKALALAEGWKGAAAGVADFIGMVVSTGVGGGIVLDGRLLDGADGNAGHIGHITVVPDGSPCACGAQGCLEAEASGTGIARRTGRPSKDATADEIERAGTMVGRAVASVANLLDLELAVVAGSVALGFGAPFFAAAQREIDLRARLDFARSTVIRPAGLGREAPLVGAAAVGWRGSGVDIGIR